MNIYQILSTVSLFVGLGFLGASMFLWNGKDKDIPLDPKKDEKGRSYSQIDSIVAWGESTDFWVYALGQTVEVKGASELTIKTKFGETTYRAAPDENGKLKWVSINIHQKEGP